jgi:hypothetical protein
MTAWVALGAFSLEVFAGTIVFKKQDYVKPDHIHQDNAITWVAEKPKSAMSSTMTSIASAYADTYGLSGVIHSTTRTT